MLVTPQRLPNPALVGRSALTIAEQAGISVPPGTRALIAPLEGVGRDYPCRSRSSARCSPITWSRTGEKGCERCKQILRYGGMGHTMAIHSQERAGDSRVRPAEAGVPHLREHADDARIDWTDHGARARHDARVRRLRRKHHVRQHLAAPPAEHQAPRVRGEPGQRRRPDAGSVAPCGTDSELGDSPLVRDPDGRGLPKAPARPAPEGISAATLASRIDDFLAARGVRPAGGVEPPRPESCRCRPTAGEREPRLLNHPRARPRRISSVKTTCGRPSGRSARLSSVSAPS